MDCSLPAIIKDKTRNYIEKKHRYIGAKSYDLNSEYMETSEEIIFGYMPEHYYIKVTAFLSKHNGLDLEGCSPDNPPALVSNDRRIFIFDKLIEVSHCYPLHDPDNDFLMITNGQQTLFAYSNGEVKLFDAWLSVRGN
jgi:hypothetical protein